MISNGYIQALKNDHRFFRSKGPSFLRLKVALFGALREIMRLDLYGHLLLRLILLLDYLYDLRSFEDTSQWYV